MMFESKTFMTTVLRSIQRMKKSSNAIYANSSAPFDAIGVFSRESMILSSWTVKSEVGS
eukprot:CAMPEP_0171306860 /NCGR_PEP_ID=MMETSP0816-20121228/16931_1 /TAXON_ID=420281 /ORGANISM="Proboscia inermis, Strain CCAP1064/1" /LENGTH=58 /DNA_ID=CAMNT_0011788731 /DNA_START=80 /DNA_END=253 /DNA_ORIENTATION=-